MLIKVVNKFNGEFKSVTIYKVFHLKLASTSGISGCPPSLKIFFRYETILCILYGTAVIHRSRVIDSPCILNEHNL